MGLGLRVSFGFARPNNLDCRAHRHGKRFVMRADEKLTAFLEAERAIHQFAVSLIA
jgi:hypothetical protein